MLKKIEEMVNLQNKLNNETCGKDWESGKTNKGRKIDWQLCMLMEGCELYDSLNWKHWKNIDQKDDLQNAIVEVVDIFHFLISECIRRRGIDVTVSLLELELSPLNIYTELTREESIKAFIHTMSGEQQSLIKYIKDFNALMYHFDIDVDKLYSLYIGKNILNQFRQDNGYREGYYIKNWDGEEDNVVMLKLLPNSVNGDMLYSQLNAVYNGVKLRNKEQI